jgi:hypothetical protein
LATSDSFQSIACPAISTAQITCARADGLQYRLLLAMTFPFESSATMSPCRLVLMVAVLMVLVMGVRGQ